jgi:tripartite-type tricarboxylate transporter receptor subunit TctC
MARDREETMTWDAKRKHTRRQTTALAARLFAASIVIGAALVAAIAPTTAQNYPDKPIRIIVAAAAGGPSDFPARLAAQILSPKLGQPVIVENRAGAGGAIGAREVAKSKPDGYTLLLGNTSTLAVIPAVSVSAGYDPVKDFAPIAKVTEGFQILVVHPSSPWKTTKDFVDYAKANPGKINYATSGPGGLPHLAGEVFMLRSGSKLTAVSYRSGGESIAAVLSQSVHATFENIAILGALIRDGKMRALAVQSTHRTPLLPDVPTMAEAGYPDAEAYTFFGLAAPAGTPAPILARLNAVLNEGLQSADIRANLVKAGTEAKPGSPADFADFIAAQHRRWVEVGKAGGVKID